MAEERETDRKMSDAEEWKLAVQLGKEQGLREAQALAVSFLRERARKEWAIGHHHSNDVLMAAADKLSEMKFLTVPQPTVMTPDRPTGEPGEAKMPGYASHLLQQYLAETRGSKPPADALDQYQIELLRFWMSHLEHILREHVEDQRKVETVLAEFLYGAMPHSQDAMERERLRTIAADAISTTTRPRFTDKFPYGKG